jgi:hypothetical protein
MLLETPADQLPDTGLRAQLDAVRDELAELRPFALEEETGS